MNTDRITSILGFLTATLGGVAYYFPQTQEWSVPAAGIVGAVFGWFTNKGAAK